MASKSEREWWVKVNIDDLCHDLDRLESTEERGQWLEGFRVGSRGHDPRDTWGAAKMLGYGFGMVCHDEAVIYRDKKVIAGQISADSRREKNGTAQPLKMIPAEHTPNSVRTVLGICSEHNPEQTPEHAPNQPTTNSYQPTASNEKRTAKNEQLPHTPRGGLSVGASDVVGVWNAATKGSGLPSARMVDKRIRLIKTRLKDSGWLSDFTDAVAYIVKSPFHRGDNDRKWVADIDYLLQPGKATQIAEKAKADPLQPSGGKAMVKWGGFDQVDYNQAGKECRKDGNGNFYL